MAPLLHSIYTLLFVTDRISYFSMFWSLVLQGAAYRVVVACCTLFMASGQVVGASEIREPTGYRMDNYDAPVPHQLTGATVVDAFEVQRLMKEHRALVIDVIPEHRKPDFLPENQIWTPPAHKGVRGSIWLPDIGYGALSEVTEKYFKGHLEKHTGGNRDHPVVFYCRMDCWMSWNAGKRALSYGYTSVYWFSYGIDGWSFEDFDLQKLIPEPGIRQ